MFRTSSNRHFMRTNIDLQILSYDKENVMKLGKKKPKMSLFAWMLVVGFLGLSFLMWVCFYKSPISNHLSQFHGWRSFPGSASGLVDGFLHVDIVRVERDTGMGAHELMDVHVGPQLLVRHWQYPTGLVTKLILFCWLLIIKDFW